MKIIIDSRKIKDGFGELCYACEKYDEIGNDVIFEYDTKTKKLRNVEYNNRVRK